MKQLPEETSEQWLKRVVDHELAQAQIQIARGDEPYKVMELLAKRITDKGLHSLTEVVKETYKTQYEHEDRAWKEISLTDKEKIDKSE